MELCFLNRREKWAGVMRPQTGIAATILISFTFATPSSATESEDDRIACGMKIGDACTRLIENESESAATRWTALSTRGTLFDELGEHDRALLDFREAVRLDPGNLGVSPAGQCFAIAAGASGGMPVYGSGIAYRKTQAQEMALSRCAAESRGGPACTLVEADCDLFADLPPSIVPGASKRCSLGAGTEISGTLLDVKRHQRGWTMGTKTYVNTCTGLVDPSTGLAVLFGNGSLPKNCSGGAAFVASGEIASGFRPEFFLKVRKIACER
jgi:hypothetical protein